MLLTGATGFLGMELLARYLERTERPVYALVRAASEGEADRAAARARCTACSAPGTPTANASIAVRGDLTSDGLGLGPRRVAARRARQRDRARRRLGVLRAAAGRRRARSTWRAPGGCSSFAELCQAHAGRAAALHLHLDRVRRGRARRHLQRGRPRRRPALPQPLRALEVRGRGDRQTLALAPADHGRAPEHRRGRARQRLDRRRSTSSTGRCGPSRAAPTASCPRARGAPVDVVPVDYVADADLRAQPGPAGRWARPSTSPPGATRAASASWSSWRAASSAVPAPRLVEPAVYRRVVHPLLRARQPRRAPAPRAAPQRDLLPLLHRRASPTTTAARAALLHGTGIEPPPLREYFDRLVEFALAADWGKRDLRRASAAVGAHRRPTGACRDGRGAQLAAGTREQLVFA